LLVVYFSNVSGNTERFVAKLDLDSQRIPLYATEEFLEVSRNYVLIIPTYGGGSSKGAVPKQVIKFLNNDQNRKFLKGIISMGNTNFGAGFCLAGEVVSKKTQVPILARVELLGTKEDVEEVRHKIKELGEQVT